MPMFVSRRETYIESDGSMDRVTEGRCQKSPVIAGESRQRLLVSTLGRRIPRRAGRSPPAWLAHTNLSAC